MKVDIENLDIETAQDLRAAVLYSIGSLIKAKHKAGISAPLLALATIIAVVDLFGQISSEEIEKEMSWAVKDAIKWHELHNPRIRH